MKDEGDGDIGDDHDDDGGDGDGDDCDIGDDHHDRGDHLIMVAIRMMMIASLVNKV